MRKLVSKEGQFSRDFERLGEATIEIDAKKLADETIKISKVTTDFIAVLPEGKKLSVNMMERLATEFPTIQQTNQLVRNSILQQLAIELLNILRGK